MPVFLAWTLGGIGLVAFIALIAFISYKCRDSFILFEGICCVFDVLGEIACSIGDAAGDIDIGD